ncbi:5-formyltetrahydrofolate cyclo-ligase [Brachybacterium sp. NBEC-018]|uniref:5-formyltetrahydrofolate cyclo-ligase n=1 Tax=Brachybacterium sp. NBEC-018 TaxID=2996004 RepID=UPI002174D729|nr:5-formyltetrahydrofolate cyclo-ligase [Brachybacterium sp. NBEC-018]UVY83227.1 5-formyltetrahydrofolate cyclo-ligase [Brachybacterium sp. NBEC-018]
MVDDSGTGEPRHGAEGGEDAPQEAKRRLRRAVRAARRARYAGEEGARRREEEASRILAGASGIIAEVTAAVARADREPVLVACFRPLPTEADVMPLALALAEAGAGVLFPVATGGEELDWVRWDGDETAFTPSPAGGFGAEPTGDRLGPGALATTHLVLAPALAVDRSGTRLGHGGGYYDRALAPAARVRVVAVVHPAELLAAGSLPRESFDRPVAEVLTAEGLERVGDGTGE